MSPADLYAVIVSSLQAALSSTEQIVAIVSSIVAVALIVVSSFVKTMIPLRWLAVGSNVGFVVYGVLHPSIPMLALNALLLPINVVRAVEMVRLTRRVRAAAGNRDGTGIWLKPYMVRTKRKNGDILFRKGDTADQLYFLAEGRIELVEIGGFIEPGHDVRRDRLLRARSAPHAHRALRRGMHRPDDRRKHRQAALLPEPGLRIPADVAGRGAADCRCAAAAEHDRETQGVLTPRQVAA